MRIYVIVVLIEAQIECCLLFSCVLDKKLFSQLQKSNVREPDIIGPSQDGW
jgi:hypothetical protein